ncbi:MAG: hypothetical protein JWQ89_3747 [Devosia sp.]|uniref:DUF4438 family protein n=1 Tax=Devosia sp. TaxID=1871048 RepID=UPI00260FFEE9|nr:DUF4438 domain-containing protein [Devosia sp.]MDB5542020.1 hypothetical protein [Devosia sp.]
MATNAHRLITTRIKAQIQPGSANVVVRPDGISQTLPGQGGVVTGIGLGDVASRWTGDHVEPGVSLGHADPAANHAIRLLSCVGNVVTVLDGPTTGARGTVFGKHGAVLAMFAPNTVARLAPGESVAIDAQGVGLALEEVPELVIHSCSPALFDAMVRLDQGRLRVGVAAILPSIAAAAGIGMPAAMFNMDLHSWSAPVAQAAAPLRFGDIVAVLDQDHRYGRQHRPGWAMVGIVSHGTAIGGGHGLGLMTLMTAPASRFEFTVTDGARLDRLLQLPWGAAA